MCVVAGVRVCRYLCGDPHVHGGPTPLGLDGLGLALNQQPLLHTTTDTQTDRAVVTRHRGGDGWWGRLLR